MEAHGTCRKASGGLLLPVKDCLHGTAQGEGGMEAMQQNGGEKGGRRQMSSGSGAGMATEASDIQSLEVLENCGSYFTQEVNPLCILSYSLETSISIYPPSWA